MPAKVTVQLTTAGRKSGASRTATLYAVPDGDRYVVIGSRGGAAKDPAWALNLRAEPVAGLKVGRRSLEVRASEVDGAERERLWALLCDAFPLYATYQRRTTRTLPIFALKPIASD